MTAKVLAPSGVRSSSLVDDAAETGVFYSSGSFRLGPTSIKVRPASIPRTSLKEPGVKEKSLRKIFGSVIEEDGPTARVGLIQNDDIVLYDLPASNLRRSGIEGENQHFEMNEVELQFNDGRVVIGYTYTPLAKPSDAFQDHVLMDEERKRKLSIIAAKFGKPKS